MQAALLVYSRLPHLQLSFAPSVCLSRPRSCHESCPTTPPPCILLFRCSYLDAHYCTVNQRALSPPHPQQSPHDVPSVSSLQRRNEFSLLEMRCKEAQRCLVSGGEAWKRRRAWLRL